MLSSRSLIGVKLLFIEKKIKQTALIPNVIVILGHHQIKSMDARYLKTLTAIYVRKYLLTQLKRYVSL